MPGIYYNTLLLSRVYEQKLAVGCLEAVKVLLSNFPVSCLESPPAKAGLLLKSTSPVA